MKYHYKKKHLILLFTLIDAIGYRFFRRKLSRHFGPRILIIRIDQIGDIVLVEPFARTIKQHMPNAKITLLTTPEGSAILKHVSHIDAVKVFNPPWFSATSRFWKNVRGWFQFKKIIQSIQCDTIISLRGDFREILASAFHPGAFTLGYGVTGGGFLLDQEVTYRHEGHAVYKNLAFLKYLGIKSETTDISPGPTISSASLSSNVTKKLPIIGD